MRDAHWSSFSGCFFFGLSGATEYATPQCRILVVAKVFQEIGQATHSDTILSGGSCPEPLFGLFHYARAGDEAYALIREALAASGDIIPGNGELLIRLDPLTAPRRTQALAALSDQLTAAGACYPGTDLVLRYEVKSRPSPA